MERKREREKRREREMEKEKLKERRMFEGREKKASEVEVGAFADSSTNLKL